MNEPSLLPKYFEDRAMRDYFAAHALSGLLANDSGQRPEWASEMSYKIADAMLKDQNRKDWFVIWLGTSFTKGGPYVHIVNIWTFDITIVNFGFKFIIKGDPPISDMCFHTEKITPTKEGLQ